MAIIDRKYPLIQSIADISPHLDTKYFYVAEKDGYSVVNYSINSPEAFPPLSDGPHAAFRREFRGIMFGMDGRIISRPFHKFFNMGEREETSEYIVREGNPQAYEKLDGSMIRPVRIGGHIRWCSKMGITDVSLQVEEWLKDRPEYFKFAEKILENEVTPIFEWCSRFNKIVIDYPEPRLVWLAARSNIDGCYFARDSLEHHAEKYGIPLVRKLDFNSDIRSSQELEGIVAYMNNGEMVKVKSDWYVTLHRAKDSISRIRELCLLILDEKLDDLKPLLIQEDLKIVEDFDKFFYAKIHETKGKVEQLLEKYQGFDNPKKTFAISDDFKDKRNLSDLVFKMLDKPEMCLYEEIKSKIRDYPQNNSQFKVRLENLFGTEVNYELQY